MKIFSFLFGLMLSSQVFAADSINLQIELDHVSLKEQGWSVSHEVVIPYATPIVLTSEKDEASGFNRILKVEPIKKPNDLVELNIKYLKAKDGIEQIVQEATIITKLGEPATLSSEADEHNDKVTIKVNPEKV